MSDWSLHRHIASVGIGYPIFDRAYCSSCREPWPCPVARRKQAYERVALGELSSIADMADRRIFVAAMQDELLRIDSGRRRLPAVAREALAGEGHDS